ncbi:MAG: ribosome silencing factor [Eubacteriales bacterium]|jgi:ribosome-associated protein|nr:ribosome silencing factor [Clostridiales bacterium]
MEESTSKRNLQNATPLELAGAIIGELSKTRADNIKMLHVSDQTIIADYFVICTGTSNTQIRAISNTLEVKMGEMNVYPSHIEGLDEAAWVLLDYGSVIVHIFNSETRRFYNLEKLWADGADIDISKYIVVE